MQSAFGVEHGDEIAKFGAPSSLLKPAKAVSGAMGLGSMGRSVGMATQKLGSNTTKAGVGRLIKQPGSKVGQAQAKAGGLIGRAGTAMRAHPTATGAAIAGGGMGAGGYAGTKFRNRNS